MMDVCDFHAHILPNADHGSSSVEESLKQLALASKFGVSRIFATSHFYPHTSSVDHYLAKRNEAYRRLKERLPAGSPEIRLGAEVLLCPNIGQIAGFDKLCISGTRTVLVELPFNDFSKAYILAVKDIISKGYDVVLAHAERYDEDTVEELIEIGAKVQVNASAIVSIFRNPVIDDWIDDGVVVAIGSDIHGTAKKAYKAFAKARRRLGDYLDRIKQYTDRVWDSSSNSDI